jgi:enediyne biosynthesis protein E4
MTFLFKVIVMTLIRPPALLLLALLYLYSCHQKPAAAPPPLFELQQNTGIDFINSVVDSQQENILVNRNYYNGGGVAIGDINNDGLPDILLTSNMGENKLYLNKGNFHFEDITSRAGLHQDGQWSAGVTFADINGDGWLDIYICNTGHMNTGHRKNKLYINNHDNTFTEAAAKYGLDIQGYSTQASFFDYDGDGDLDCFLTNNSPLPIDSISPVSQRDLPDAQWPVAGNLKGGGDHLYRNDNGHFTEVTRQAGIHGSLMSFGLGVSVGDINGDGYLDIYVSNDSYERDYLYINQHDGTFKDQLEDYMGHISYSSMGADLADINNDGYLDIFTTDMLPEEDYRRKTLGEFDNVFQSNAKSQAGFYRQYMKNCLQLNNRNGHFLDIADYSGVSATDWSWGALLFDMDNDGYNDIFVCNGVIKDVTNLDFRTYFANDVLQKMIQTGVKDDVASVLQHIPASAMLHKAYRNLGDLQFADMGQSWGFTQPSFANGAAYADLDNDGALDLVINNMNGPAFVYKNNSRNLNHNHYLAVRLQSPAPNTFAIGSTIRVCKDSTIFLRQLIPSRGFQSSVDYKTIIGLGKLTTVDSLTITWPDHTITTLRHPALDTTYTIHKDPAATRNPAGSLITAHSPAAPARNTPTLLEPVKSSFQKHQEADNIDFLYEANVPKMLSREGPKVAIGDLDGDGLPDIYIGGTLNHPGQIYMQGPAGTFTQKAQPAFEPFKDFEDEAVLFFDADHDGDLDLLLCPGGNAHPPYSRQMQNRLFKNDGKGNFTLDATAFPMNNDGMNTGVAITCDLNGDGYPDLFIGGRSEPREYGTAPRSFLFLNDGSGHFTDIAQSKNPDIANIGMVTAAAWADLLGEGRPQLIIAGEWMAPRIFSWKDDHFEETTTDLANLSGWWQSMAVADLNGDGLPDLVLGNVGENFYLHPDISNPVKLWINDFDQNGLKDEILTHTVNGQDMPVFLKGDMERQLPMLKRQNWTNAEYAQKSIAGLVPAEALKASLVKVFNYPASIVAINRGKGKFSIQKLPAMAQLSSINAIQCADLNGDGFPDLVMGGNDFGFPPQFGRLDASFGHVLLNDGHGNFTWVDPSHSGLQLPGQIRDIGVIRSDGIYLLFLRNDDYPALYFVKTPPKK